MKQIISIAILLLSLTTTAGNGLLKLPLADPLYLATILMGAPTESRMTESCLTYGLHPLPSEDGYTVFSDDKGNRLRFKIDKSGDTTVQIVELITTLPSGKIAKILSDTGFKKTGDTYTKTTSGATSYIKAIYTGNKITISKSSFFN